jgi:hypothetical protein
LGYHFGADLEERKFSSFYVAGLRSNERAERELILAAGNIKHISDHFVYDLPPEWKFGLGSPVLYHFDDEYFVCGVHFSGKHSKESAVQLTKEMFDRLKKFTFQGYEVDLSNSSVIHVTITFEGNRSKNFKKFPSKKPQC